MKEDLLIKEVLGVCIPLRNGFLNTRFLKSHAVADGCFTVSSEDMPKYDIRAMVSEINRLGRALTDDEAEKFIIA